MVHPRERSITVFENALGALVIHKGQTTPGTTSATIEGDLAELIDLWRGLDQVGQADLLAVARGWAVQQSQHARNHPHNPHKTAADGN